MLFWQFNIQKTRSEIFPFFSWSLFSKPSKKVIKYYLKIDRVDGVAIDSKVGIISVGDKGIRLAKSIKKVLRKCKFNAESNFLSLYDESCEKDAIKFLSPYINLTSKYKHLEFSIFLCFIDAKKFSKQLGQGITRFPKFVDCELKKKLGPWSIRK